MNFIYLDYNATAPVRPEVVERMAALLPLANNPSSVHKAGREARRVLEVSRKTVCELLNCWPQELIWTASASEANNAVIQTFTGRPVWVSAIEHSSVLAAAPAAGRIPVTADGLVDVDWIAAKLEAGERPALISVMLANNETGVIQPVQEIAALAREHGVLVHCDAVQGVGKIPVDFTALGVDYLTISAHKCGGAVGAAALVVKNGAPFAPFIKGGGQEYNRRAGTENIPAIAGFALAMELAQDVGHMQTLRAALDRMEAVITSSVVGGGGLIFGGNAPRLPNTSCIAMPGVGQEVQLMHFDLAGLMVSAGSACSSGRIEPSHVLLAMDVPEMLAKSAIRISAGWGTKPCDIEAFTEEWLALAHRTPAKACGAA